MTTTTRSSAKERGNSTNEGAPPASKAEPGSKHKVEEGTKSPEPKRPKKSDEKEQKTIEETIGGSEQTKQEQQAEQQEQQEKIAKDSEKEDVAKAEKETATGDAEEPREDAKDIPSSILEKGIIYFFFRGRVGIDRPSDVDEIARSYIILRPIAKDAKLGSGPIGDAGNSRVCVVPKKVLPKTGKDRWISFVEKTGASFSELKDEFLKSNDYETKTAGTRHSPAATPVAEGVYAITSTGKDSHLAYILTLPDKLGEVQKEIGLKEKGSFIISTRNPQYEPPKNARLPKGPEYPKELLEEFRSLRWAPTQPRHLDYVNTQFLLVGESSGIAKALEQQKKDQKEGKNEPAEELEQLEEEDAQRMQDLDDDDAARIFADLQADAGHYPKLPTTF
ncbi:uncharacterized protein PODANS_1_15960 [Podospora anserina S mat+]|uniref:Podospora anserina S mat+ genomic DNA chromosome 1, supercontig 4 n=1 Tax=Podospora anserina (strain S / ATCC MYA-4624 / DSM 980 / FGSC 10383) TaxID=515849 RepID=B2ATI3_PODAN|nr:uncharacterized protein PODANS_1_15960 [Podospora anserina S mat+]CAP67706.1 unnamed protein product [Podospora anserina S mat+]CDP23965.1 Putative protein of unknown function [Podospora anserina S mat+]